MNLGESSLDPQQLWIEFGDRLEVRQSHAHLSATWKPPAIMMAQ
jgi:hypothetical protein